MATATPPGPGQPDISARLTIPGDPMAVRAGLRSLFDTILLRGLTAEDRGAAEIVLAEALNNIVEHAYSHSRGEIEITLQLRQTELICTIVDAGKPMPENSLPAGNLAPLGAVKDLPEGGFGWHVIRSLSKDLHYQRVDGQNQLSFRLDTTQPTN